MDRITGLGKFNLFLNEDSKSKELYSRALQVMPGGNTRVSNFTLPFPLYAAHGKGCKIFDVEGVERIDFHNNFTTMILGHANPMVIEAVTKQIEKGISFAISTEEEIKLAEIICERLPSIERIRFANSGTEAVMYAVKAARAYTGKEKIAKFEAAFHGNYDFLEVSLSPSLSEAGNRRYPSPILRDAGVFSGVLDYALVLPWNDADASSEAIRENRDNLAAVIVDPMPNYTGYIPPKLGFLEAIREATTQNDIPLIFDEVLNLRLGFHGAQGRFGVMPDITALGKLIGGGFPIGAFGGRAEIMEVFNPSKGPPKVTHSGTGNANPVLMAAGQATMHQLTPSVFETLETLGDSLRASVGKIFENLDFPGQITGLGSNFRIHMTDRELVDYRNTLLDDKQQAMKEALYFNLLAKDILIMPSGMGCLSIPMNETEIAQFLQALEDSIRDLKKHHL
jgi:glutamate-1-semialdehyde 2,1-aminomutase